MKDCFHGEGSDTFAFTATMTRIDEYTMPSETKADWSVAVVYEDSAARERAVDFCDQLVQRFWGRFEFEVNWWSFQALQEHGMALDAADKAARANLVVLSSLGPQDLPARVKTWIESWLSRRGDLEGILAGLIEPADAVGSPEAGKHLYLRQVAHRAGMDYLTQVPQDISRSIPDSPECYSLRAAQVSTVLDEILHHRAPPPALT